MKHASLGHRVWGFYLQAPRRVVSNQALGVEAAGCGIRSANRRLHWAAGLGSSGEHVRRVTRACVESLTLIGYVPRPRLGSREIPFHPPLHLRRQMRCTERTGV